MPAIQNSTGRSSSVCRPSTATPHRRRYPCGASWPVKKLRRRNTRCSLRRPIARLGEREQIGALLIQIPVLPGDGVVLAVGVVVAALGAPHLIPPRSIGTPCEINNVARKSRRCWARSATAPHANTQRWARTIVEAFPNIDRVCSNSGFAGHVCAALFPPAQTAMPSRPALSLPLTHPNSPAAGAAQRLSNLGDLNLKAFLARPPFQRRRGTKQLCRTSW